MQIRADVDGDGVIAPAEKRLVNRLPGTQRDFPFGRLSAHQHPDPLVCQYTSGLSSRNLTLLDLIASLLDDTTQFLGVHILEVRLIHEQGSVSTF